MKDCRDFLDMQETKIFTHIPYVPFLQKLLFYQEEGIETGNPPQGLGRGNPEWWAKMTKGQAYHNQPKLEQVRSSSKEVCKRWNW